MAPALPPTPTSPSGSTRRSTASWAATASAPSTWRSLTYTKQVVQELLRLYPVGWQFPRVAVRCRDIDGFPVKAGQTLLHQPVS